MDNLPYRNKDPSSVTHELTVDSILEELRNKPPPEQLAEPEDTPAPLEEHSEPEEHKPPKEKKGIFWDVVFYVALIVLVLGVLFVKSGSGGAPVSIAGFSIHTVLTGSMQDEIPQGSLVLARQVDPAALQIGDDITYMKDETNTVTHRIVGIIENFEDTGQRAFETQGIMNKAPDKLPVPAANVVGKIVFHNYPLGVAMSFLSQHWHLLLLFLLLFIGLFGAIRSWKKARREEKDKQRPNQTHTA